MADDVRPVAMLVGDRVRAAEHRERVRAPRGGAQLAPFERGGVAREDGRQEEPGRKAFGRRQELRCKRIQSERLRVDEVRSPTW